MEGEHFGAGDGAVALEEDGGGGLAVLLPVEGHAKREDVHHLKIAHPAARTSSPEAHMTAIKGTLTSKGPQNLCRRGKCPPPQIWAPCSQNRQP